MPRLHQRPAAIAKIPLFCYEFPVDRIIHAYKYGHQLAVGNWAAEFIAQQVANNTYDLLIPMPLHPDRLCERGFNQAAEIARRISLNTGQQLTTETLTRSRASKPQAELPMKERSRNVRGAFECNTDLNGKRVLLIDDVMTTGATLREASRILKLLPARNSAQHRQRHPPLRQYRRRTSSGRTARLQLQRQSTAPRRA